MQLDVGVERLILPVVGARRPRGSRRVPDEIGIVLKLRGECRALGSDRDPQLV